MSNFILALDQGTTSSRAIVFDRDGKIRGCAQREFPQIFPSPGWVEHDANDIWTTQLSVAQQVLRENGLASSDIAAIGITNQRETTVLWNRITGEPVARAIVWQDRRTAGFCESLREAGYEPPVRQKTGLVLDSYFAATKLKWLLDNVAGAREMAERGVLAFGTIDSWLCFKLCGVHVTDTSNASRTLLFNIHTLEWDAELLDIFGIPRSLLPEVVPTSGVVASTRVELFGTPIQVAGMAGDQQAATFGQGCHHQGMAKNTYGTGCFMLMNTGPLPVTSKNNLLTTIGWDTVSSANRSATYMLEGSVFMAGATIQWLRDGLQIIEDSSQIEALATSVTDNGGVIFVPAFTGLGAPYWDSYARGTILGMTRGSTKAHIARAALESIAYQTADVLTAMQKDSAIGLNELRVDGGAARNDLLMQFQADILNVPVVRPVVIETTALGAAFLAGLAVGFWSSMDEIASKWQLDRRFVPSMSESERSQRLNLWHRAVERSRAWAE
jgi:glycerol kinase